MYLRKKKLFKVGKILFHSHLEGFLQMLLWIKGKRFVSVFPSYATLRNVQVLCEMIMLNVCEHLSLVWIYSESIGPKREQQ